MLEYQAFQFRLFELLYLSNPLQPGQHILSPILADGICSGIILNYLRNWVRCDIYSTSLPITWTTAAGGNISSQYIPQSNHSNYFFLMLQNLLLYSILFLSTGRWAGLCLILFPQFLSLKKRVQAVHAWKLLVHLKMPKLRNKSLFLFKNGEVCRLVGKFSD